MLFKISIFLTWDNDNRDNCVWTYYALKLSRSEWKILCLFYESVLCNDMFNEWWTEVFINTQCVHCALWSTCVDMHTLYFVLCFLYFVFCTLCISDVRCESCVCAFRYRYMDRDRNRDSDKNICVLRWVNDTCDI
jgi:hypothetical protein